MINQLKIKIKEIKDNRMGYLFISPALIAIILLTIYPALRTLWLSFTKYNLIFHKEPIFNGLNNYIDLFNDSFFWEVFGNTAIFSSICVVGTMLLGFFVALIINQDFIGSKIVAISVLLPWIMPKIAATIVWKWMYNTEYGILNYLLSSVLHISNFANYNWLGSQFSGFLSIAILVIWQSFPFVALSYLAGFQSINKELYEAAEVDGANFWHKLRFITLPSLRSLTMILVILSTIWDFKIFDQVYVLTEGGPGRKTYVLGVYSWMKAFGEMAMGKASAIAIFIFIILLIVTFIYIKVLKREGEI